MSDISKCSGKGCKLKKRCYRYTAKSGLWQAYFTNPPIKDGKCDMFWGETSESVYNDLKKITNGK
jgi:hypothetical protein